MSYGTNIRKCRTIKGLTQAELSQRTDISIKTISRYEHERIASPDINKIAKIANALDVEIKDIFNLDDSEDNHIFYMLNIDAENGKYGLKKLGKKENNFYEGLHEQLNKSHIIEGKETVFKLIEDVESVVEFAFFGGCGIMREDIYEKYFAEEFNIFQ